MGDKTADQAQAPRLTLKQRRAKEKARRLLRTLRRMGPTPARDWPRLGRKYLHHRDLADANAHRLAEHREKLRRQLLTLLTEHARQ